MAGGLHNHAIHHITDALSVTMMETQQPLQPPTLIELMSLRTRDAAIDPQASTNDIRATKKG